MTGRMIHQQPNRCFRQFLAATAATNSILQSNWSEQWCPAQRPEPWHQHEPHRQVYTAGHLQAFLSPIFKIQHQSKHNYQFPSKFHKAHSNQHTQTHNRSKARLQHGSNQVQTDVQLRRDFRQRNLTTLLKPLVNLFCN